MIWSTLLNAIMFYTNALYLIPRLISKRRYNVYIVAAILLYAGIVLINSLLDHTYSLSIFSSEKEPLFAEVVLNIGSKILIFSLSLGYGLTKNWINTDKIRQQLERDKLQTELKYLKAQINPHFLFNTLNMAYASAIKSNDDQTADIIEKLSSLMRYVLYEGNEERVSLEKEIDYINTYVHLQLKRMSPELTEQVQYQVKGESRNHKIAPMLLMPFVENVFKHGIMLSKKPEMAIVISIFSDRLVLESRNLKNYRNQNEEKRDSGIGLKNARERLKLIYPDKHKLEIEDTGNVFNIKLELQLV
jgi:LytS/YehU family sensor histidine kinase